MSIECSAASIGARLRELRRRRGFTVTDVARRVSVSTPCMSQWENGRNPPGQSFLGPLAEVLQTHIGYILTGEGDPDRAPETGRFIIPPTAAYVINQAREQIADALGVSVTAVRVQISVPADPLIGSSLEISD